MSDMTCAEYRDRVEDVLDGLLAPEDSERFDAHRGACADCSVQWAEAGRFRDLLAREGRAALGAWEARRLSVHAATLLGGGDASLPQVPDVTPRAGAGRRRFTARRFTVLRFTVFRLAAAAVVVAAAGLIGSGLLGDPGPVVLAAGVETRLNPGTQATFGHECRLVVEDRAATLTLRERASHDDDATGGSGDILQMDRGVALFRVHPEHALGVATPQGLARAVGATFVVDVRGDGAVAVDVVTGRVRIERERGDLMARPGERVEIDSSGAAHIVSRSRIDELELAGDRRNDDNEAIQSELDRVQRQLDDYIRAMPEKQGADAGGDDVPYAELGRAMAVLSDRAIPWRDERRNEAMALFLLNAKRIQEEFGVSDPMRAQESPAFAAAAIEGFLGALAPEASPSDVAAAAAEMCHALGAVEADIAGEPLPTELSASRQRALIDMIRSTESHLGVAVAVKFVAAFRGAWDGPRPSVQALDDRFEGKVVGYWAKSLTLDEEQTNQVAGFVRAYVAQSVAMQQRVAATLPPDEVESVLFPRRTFGPRSRHSGSENAEPKAEPARERTNSEIVAARLREIDARLHLAEPRALYERALWNVLRPEQRDNAFRRGATLFTFRQQDASER